MIPAEPARIHLLPSKASKYVVIIRRKPSKWFHIVRWDTRSDAIEHGSWFRGKLYVGRCDVSFDGKWMVYLARGSNGHAWNGICNPPYLRSVAEAPETATFYGGGYWSDQRTLMLNHWKPTKGEVPFTLDTLSPQFGEDLGVLYPRLMRDGWQRIGDNWGKARQVPKTRDYLVECIGDDGWRARPSPAHPYIFMRYVGYLRHGYTFRYSLESSDLLDEAVDSACWDAMGNLVFSRCGIVYRYSLRALADTKPSHVLDLDSLQVPKSPSTDSR